MNLKRTNGFSARSGKLQDNLQLLTLALPGALALLVFNYLPMFGIVIAFKKYNPNLGILGSKWVGLSNFRRLLESYWFPIILRTTLTLSGLSLLIGFPVPIILALMVNEVQREAPKRLFQTVSYAPHFISTVVVCGMIQIFLSPSSGIINNLIERLGGQAVYFMGHFLQRRQCRGRGEYAAQRIWHLHQRQRYAVDAR